MHTEGCVLRARARARGGGDEYIHYHDCGDDFTSVYTYANISQMVYKKYMQFIIGEFHLIKLLKIIITTNVSNLLLTQQ